MIDLNIEKKTPENQDAFIVYVKWKEISDWSIQLRKLAGTVLQTLYIGE